jgi:large subunit ribosomal protein L25
MREVTLQGEVRTQLGKHSRLLRRQGQVPGIFYLHGEQNIPVVVPEKSLRPLLQTSEAHVINLKLDGGSRSCILRDVQFDPVTDQPVHFDLQGLKEDEEITLEVPIVVTGGTPVGVRDGGILQQLIHRLEISCLPKYIPEQIEVNVENLKINQFLHVSDLKLDNVTILESETTTIVGVVPPVIEKEPEPGVVPVEEAAEPEVIGKGKKPEEGAEGESAAGEKKADAGTAAPTAGGKSPAAGGKAPTGKEEKEKK